MIHLVVAHPAEARPLIARYNLQGDPAPFPLYRGDGMLLVVSGPGRTAAAAAAGFLAGVDGAGPGTAWLNLGMAGHSELPIGQGLLAQRVHDATSGATWFPALVFDAPCPTAPVVTVERLEQDYEDEPLYDTEAAGFFAAASRFASVELVHAYKIVIDNHGATLGDNFTAEVMEDLVQSKLVALESVLLELRSMANQVRERTARSPVPAAGGEG